MSDPKLVLRGENIEVTLFVNRVPQRVSQLVKSMKITQVAVQHRDQYLGRQRARTDKQVDGYDASLELDYSDSVLIDALMAQDAAREANQPVPEITLKFDAHNRDGSLNSYFLTRVTSKFDLGMSGRTESVSQTVELQAEDLKKAA